MKYFLILVLISLAGCSSNTITTNDKYQYGGAVDLGINVTRDWYYTVPRHAMDKHQQCVHFALKEMSVGEECKWQAGSAVGIVKVGRINASGCHSLLNTVYYKDKPKYFQENYCYNNSYREWYKS